MQVNVFNIDKKIKLEGAVAAEFSFSVFTADIKDRIAKEKTVKAEFYKLVLAKIAEYPELEYPLPVEDVIKYKKVLELVYAILSPPIADEADYYWGIATPIPGDVVYGTDAFQQFIIDYNADPNTIINQGSKAFNKRLEEYVYRMVLEKLYHISSDINIDTIYKKDDVDNGLEQYYKIHIDTCFVSVTANQPLPELKPELIDEFLQAGTGADVLQEVLPLSMFKVAGFSIVTVEDVTAGQSIENIKQALVNDTADQNEIFERVTHSLQTLTGNSTVEFGLLPFLKVNGKLIYNTEECFTSVLVKAYAAKKIPEEVYAAMATGYIKKPKAIFFNEINNSNAESQEYLKVLKEAGIKSYAILPVYYNRKLAGVMEIYSKANVVYYDKLLSKLEAAVPLLSQLMRNSTEQFNERIEDVIKDKFTTLQQAVQWKFNEVAWNYIRQQRENPERQEIKTVSFKDVSPLYGAVDIRNSTAERNVALQRDLAILLKKMMETLAHVSECKYSTACQELVAQAEAWLERIAKQITDNDEASIRTFLEAKVYPVFDELRAEFPQMKPMIDAYFETADEGAGEGFAGRRELEDSIGMINTALNNYFERAHLRLQEIFPCYFEKFRTDGVEYDIYTGQSLAPDKPFDDTRLMEFRRWQLKSMIDIVHINNRLTGLMNCKLQTTQLIFVHSGPIDITFRKDERRFDVEGTYNIRYEVIKKRIDKVLVKDTGERLTQPGKIALVYSSDSEADEFMAYIKEFQDKGLLNHNVEQLELEELQGVTGLSAIRMTVEPKVS